MCRHIIYKSQIFSDIYKSEMTYIFTLEENQQLEKNVYLQQLELHWSYKFNSAHTFILIHLHFKTKIKSHKMIPLHWYSLPNYSLQLTLFVSLKALRNILFLCINFIIYDFEQKLLLTSGAAWPHQYLLWIGFRVSLCRVHFH